jgi:hypothetical protein
MRIQERGVSKGNEKFYEPSKSCEKNSNKELQVVFALCSSAQEESRSRGRRVMNPDSTQHRCIRKHTADNVATRLRYKRQHCPWDVLKSEIMRVGLLAALLAILAHVMAALSAPHSLIYSSAAVNATSRCVSRQVLVHTCVELALSRRRQPCPSHILFESHLCTLLLFTLFHCRLTLCTGCS